MHGKGAKTAGDAGGGGGENTGTQKEPNGGALRGVLGALNAAAASDMHTTPQKTGLSSPTPQPRRRDAAYAARRGRFNAKPHLWDGRIAENGFYVLQNSSSWGAGS